LVPRKASRAAVVFAARPFRRKTPDRQKVPRWDFAAPRHRHRARSL